MNEREQDGIYPMDFFEMSLYYVSTLLSIKNVHSNDILEIYSFPFLKKYCYAECKAWR